MKNFMLILSLIIYPVLGQGEWEIDGTLLYEVDESMIFKPNDTLTVFVGGYHNYQATDYIQVYNSNTKSCELIGFMPINVTDPAVIDLENGSEFMIAGGIAIGAEPASRNDCYICNYFTGECRETGFMQIDRNHNEGILLSDGKILVALGSDHNEGSTFEIWDPETEEFFFLGTADCNKYFFSLIKRNGLIYAIGDDEKGMVFNEETYSWDTIFEFDYEWIYFGIAVNQDNNFIISSGRRNNPYFPYVNISAIVNPDTGEITMIDTVNCPGDNSVSFCVDNGTCYRAGGFIIPGGPMNSFEGYINNDWIELDPMPVDLKDPFASRMPDGKFLVTGNGNTVLTFSWNNEPSIGTVQYSSEPPRSSIVLEAFDPNVDDIKACLSWYDQDVNRDTTICSEYQESGSVFEFDIEYALGPINAQVFDIWSESDIHNSCSEIVELVLLSIDDITTPTGFILNQNYPNPFNPETTISYELINASYVQLTIYDLRGQEVAILVNSYQFTGDYHLTWQAPDDLASGMYILKLITETKNASKSIILLK